MSEDIQAVLKRGPCGEEPPEGNEGPAPQLCGRAFREVDLSPLGQMPWPVSHLQPHESS